jgi:hypothetical protein
MTGAGLLSPPPLSPCLFALVVLTQKINLGKETESGYGVGKGKETSSLAMRQDLD